MIEDEIDKTVVEIYGIIDEELEEIRKCLKDFNDWWGIKLSFISLYSFKA